MGGGGVGPYGQGPADSTYPPQPPFEPGATTPFEPSGTTPFEPGGTPPTDASIDLTPLDDMPDRRRFLSVGRLIAVSVVVLALVGGAAAFALGGDDNDTKGDGVASIDGSTGDVDDQESSGNGTAGPADDTEVYDAMLKFAECMREHGIDMPDPEMGEDGVQLRAGVEGGPNEAGPNEDEFEAAQKACEHFMEDVRGDMDLSPEEQAEMRDKLVAMAECMRGRGYDMPDPEISEDGGVKMKMGRGPDDGPPQDDEQLEKDQEECNAEAGLGEDGPMSAGGSDDSKKGSS
jgi:hypothetical protein